MSSTVSGTNSPPLEATGEDKPMGASSIESAQKGEQVKAVPDSEQRKQYFQPTELEDSNSKKATYPPNDGGPHAMGRSLQDEFEKRT